MILSRSHANVQNIFKLDILIRLLITVRKRNGLLEQAEVRKTGFLQILILITYCPKRMTSVPAWVSWHSAAISGILLPLFHIPRPLPHSSSKLFFPLHLLFLFIPYVSHSHAPYSIFLSSHAQNGHFWHASQEIAHIYFKVCMHCLTRCPNICWTSWILDFSKFGPLSYCQSPIFIKLEKNLTTLMSVKFV